MKIKLLKKLIWVKKNRTVVIVSHRKNTVKYYDNIFLMKNWIIKELGEYKKIENVYDEFFVKNN